MQKEIGYAVVNTKTQLIGLDLRTNTYAIFTIRRLARAFKKKWKALNKTKVIKINITRNP
jgi:hypothetical protein